MDNDMIKYKIGYTQGVFDMFHIGHLHLLNRAKEQCDYLIVGVNSDSLVQEYKKKKTVIDEKSRAMIVSNIKCVDKGVIVYTLDKIELYKRFRFDAVFIGDDWKGNDRWKKTEEDLSKYGVDVVYLPHTPDISSTLLRVEVPKRVD